MLTVTQIQALKPATKPYKVADDDGLFLLVQPSGALLWPFRYRAHGIERKLSLGTFPKVPARASAREAGSGTGRCGGQWRSGREKRQRTVQGLS